MSRTVLLSEVGEIAERFPEAVASAREVLCRTALPQGGEAAVSTMAEWTLVDPVFREELEHLIATIGEQSPEVSHLEVLGILVVAATGTAKADPLADTPDLDLAVRTLFRFVLDTRRKQRDPEAHVSAPLPAAFVPQAPARPTPMPNVPEPAHWTSLPEQTAETLHTVRGTQPRLTTTLPGDSGMLARALAFAVEEDEAGPVSAAPQRVAAHSTSSEQVTPRQRRHTPLAPVTAAPVFAPQAAVLDEEDNEDEDDAILPPRRWGMWSGVACGILLGFGLGVFLHFDHNSARPVGRQLDVANTPADTGTPSAAPAKSIDQLRAEIAALDSVASVAPYPGDLTGKAAQPTILRRLTPAERREHAGVKGSRVVEASHEVHGPVAALHNAAPAQPGRTVVQPASSATPASAAGASLSYAAAHPVTLNSLGGGVSRSAGASAMPRVTTGSAGIMAANLVSSPAPAYPAAASAAGVQGEVVVEAVVGRDGEVVGTRIVSGPLLLRAAALDAVQRWHYRPYEVDGKPIEIATTARLEFRLEP